MEQTFEIRIDGNQLVAHWQWPRGAKRIALVVTDVAEDAGSAHYLSVLSHNEALQSTASRQILYAAYAEGSHKQFCIPALVTKTVAVYAYAYQPDTALWSELSDSQPVILTYGRHCVRYSTTYTQLRIDGVPYSGARLRVESDISIDAGVLWYTVNEQPMRYLAPKACEPGIAWESEQIILPQGGRLKLHAPARLEVDVVEEPYVKRNDKGESI